MSTLAQRVQNYEAFAGSFDMGELPMPPAKQVAWLVCMDARLHPEKFLGLEIGDAHVIRNAGGRAPDDAIRSLVISSNLLGTKEFGVVHHTDCGMLTFSNDDLPAKLKDELGADAGDVDFLPFPDLDQSVRDDSSGSRARRCSPRTSRCPATSTRSSRVGCGRSAPRPRRPGRRGL